MKGFFCMNFVDTAVLKKELLFSLDNGLSDGIESASVKKVMSLSEEIMNRYDDAFRELAK